MNSTVIHERPGVYSSYDASAVISGGAARKVVGVAAKAAKGSQETVTLLSSYAEGVAAFGEDTAETSMALLLRMLYLNGAATVAAVAVKSTGTTADYEAAFALLEQQETPGILICDSTDVTVQQALRDSVCTASAARRERIAVVGSTGESTAELAERAGDINSERVVLVGGEGLDAAGVSMGGAASAAALAGVIAAQSDPAVPLNGALLQGMSGLVQHYSDTEIDTLVRAGVTPLESSAGAVRAVRGITTRTTTGGAADMTWRELTTILIVDNVIPQIRDALRRKFSRTKNTAQTRSAIRSQVIVELENKRGAQIIDSFGEVQVRASAEDASVCEVEFTFTVAHGLNQIYLTAHITV